MAPIVLHLFSDLSALASDADIKEVILTNYSDIPSSTEEPQDCRTSILHEQTISHI